MVRELSLGALPEAGVINGFCQLISRRLIDAIGELDEEAFPTGFGEENDYCARATAAGFRLHIADDTYVFHSKSQSFGHARRKELSKRGREALARKHPNVSWAKLTGAIEREPSLVRLRERLQQQGI